MSERPVDLEAVERALGGAFPRPWTCEHDERGGWVLEARASIPVGATLVLATRGPWEHRAETSRATGDLLEKAPEWLGALAAENRRLREALAPFAAIALHMKHTGQEALHADRLERLGWTVVLSDCKRAKEVLGG